MKLDVNYEDIKFENLIDNIFEHPPREKSSIPISFDTGDIKDMYEALLMFFTEGMKRLYGNSNGIVDLLSLHKNDFSHMGRYFESISINMNYKFYDMKEYDLMYQNHFMKDKYQNLQDYCFKLKINEKIFVLWFNIIN